MDGNDNRARRQDWGNKRWGMKQIKTTHPETRGQVQMDPGHTSSSLKRPTQNAAAARSIGPSGKGFEGEIGLFREVFQQARGIDPGTGKIAAGKRVVPGDSDGFLHAEIIAAGKLL